MRSKAGKTEKTILGHAMAIVCLLAIGISAIAGVYKLGKSLSQSLSHQSAKGVVIACEPKWLSTHKETVMVVEIEGSVEHAQISGHWLRSKSFCEQLLGHSIQVLLDPDDDYLGVVDSFNERWLFPLLLLTSAWVVSWCVRQVQKAA